METKLNDKLIKSFVENQQTIVQIEEKISNAIAVFQKDLEEKKKKELELKIAIKTAMVNNDIKKFENDIISLTYVAPTTRKTIDIERLKSEEPDLYEKYSKVSEVSDSIRIKIK